MKKILLLAFIIPFVASAQMTDKEMIKKGINVKEHVPKGILVNNEAPTIKSTSVTGELINSEDILANKQIVVVFYRGNWCPYCNRHLSNLNDSIQNIRDAGAEILVVGPESFETAEETKEKSKATFTLIPDTAMQIMQDFDVLFKVTKKYKGKIKTFLFTDIAKSNGHDEALLPVPATYIIGKDGKIKWRHFDYDYSKRASAKSIIKELEK